MKGAPFFSILDLIGEMEILRDHGVSRGEPCGIASLEEFFSLKKGYPLFIAGAPHAGKTEFALELLINSSILYGWKHFIYVGEGGDVEDVFAELCSKYIKRPFIKSAYGAMAEEEYNKAIVFIRKHFIVANHDLEFTVSEFYDTVAMCEDEMGIKFDTTLFDPFNDIKDESDRYGGREDKYLASALKIVRKDAKKNRRINILVNHIADVRAVLDQDSGMRYMPPALPNEWAGGRTWWRRAFTMLLVYRPPIFLKDENGVPFQPNETHVITQKSKPKGVGKLGLAKIYYDWKQNRYYSHTDTGLKLYSCERAEDIKAEWAARPELVESFLSENANHFQDDNPF